MALMNSISPNDIPNICVRLDDRFLTLPKNLGYLQKMMKKSCFSYNLILEQFNDSKALEYLTGIDFLRLETLTFENWNVSGIDAENLISFFMNSELGHPHRLVFKNCKFTQDIVDILIDLFSKESIKSRYKCTRSFNFFYTDSITPEKVIKLLQAISPYEIIGLDVCYYLIPFSDCLSILNFVRKLNMLKFLHISADKFSVPFFAELTLILENLTILPKLKELYITEGYHNQSCYYFGKMENKEPSEEKGLYWAPKVVKMRAGLIKLEIKGSYNFPGKVSNVMSQYVKYLSINEIARGLVIGDLTDPLYTFSHTKNLYDKNVLKHILFKFL